MHIVVELRENAKLLRPAAALAPRAATQPLRRQ